MPDGRGIGREHFLRIMAAAREAPDLLVAQIGHQRLERLVLAEKVLPHVSAALAFEVLIFAVHALFHALQQQAAMVLGQQLVPAAAPEDLDDVPAGTSEHALEFLHNLAVAAHRAVQALQIAIDDEDQIIQALTPGERYRPQRFGLVHLAVAHEGPDLARRGLGEAAVVQVLEKTRLVNGHQRAQAHRDGRELPKIGHQPGVRVRGQALAAGLLTEAEQLLLAQAAFEKSSCVDAGRAVALDKHQIATVRVARRVPKVPEADVVQRGRRLETGDVASEFGAILVGAQDNGQRIPANDRTQPMLDGAVARGFLFLLWRDGVFVGGGQRARHIDPIAACFVDQPTRQIAGPLKAAMLQYRLQGFEPLFGLDGVEIAQFDCAHVCSSLTGIRCASSW